MDPALQEMLRLTLDPEVAVLLTARKAQGIDGHWESRTRAVLSAARAAQFSVTRADQVGHTETLVHRDQIALRAAQKIRSELRRAGVLMVRFSTISWCRNARFSGTSFRRQ